MVSSSQQPPFIPEPFGNNASEINYPLPDTVSGAGSAAWNTGWPPATANPTGTPPAIQDFNGLDKTISGWVQWCQLGGGVPYWNSTIANLAGLGGTVGSNGGYPAGAIVQSNTFPNRLWRSTAENNVTNPDTGGAGWIALVPNVPPVTVFGTEGQALSPSTPVTLTGTIACPSSGTLLCKGSYNISNVANAGIAAALTCSAQSGTSADTCTVSQFHEKAFTVSSAGTYTVTFTVTPTSGLTPGTVSATLRASAVFSL